MKAMCSRQLKHAGVEILIYPASPSGESLH